MRADAVVVNRVPVHPRQMPPVEEMTDQLQTRGLPHDGAMTDAIRQAVEQQASRAKLAESNLTALDEINQTAEAVRVVHVPEFSQEIHDVERLIWVADRLVS